MYLINVGDVSFQQSRGKIKVRKGELKLIISTDKCRFFGQVMGLSCARETAHTIKSIHMNLMQVWSKSSSSIKDVHIPTFLYKCVYYRLQQWNASVDSNRRKEHKASRYWWCPDSLSYALRHLSLLMFRMFSKANFLVMKRPSSGAWRKSVWRIQLHNLVSRQFFLLA